MQITKPLREYQQVAVPWLQSANGGRNIYADDVGLGKSITTLAAMEPPALIVAPTYLLGQWYQLCQAVLPDDTLVSLVEGTRLQRERELAKPAHVRIVNIDMLRGYDFGKSHRTVVLDEGHHYRNRTATQTRAACRLVQQSTSAHLLTASPYYKRFDDIWSLLYMVHPDAHGSYWDFLRYWCAVNWLAPYTPTIYGLKRSKREEWQEYISKYMLLRSYADVGRDLPPLITRAVTFKMPSTLMKVYQDVHKHYKLAGSPLESAGAVLVTLRALTMCKAKLDTIAAICEDIPPTEPVVVYTWYRDSAQQVHALLSKHDKALLITGDTEPKLRSAQLERARTNGTKYICATYSALNEGANLQWARYVVFAEESYVTEEHRQTVARFLRDRGDDAQGTDQPPVVVYYVRAERTIDTHIPNARNRGARSIAAVMKGM